MMDHKAMQLHSNLKTAAIREYVVQVAEAGCRLQAANGAMPSGHNGPHQHSMTAARNTSHWSITFSHAYQITGLSKFRQAAVKALDLLVSPDLRPMNGSFWHRCHAGKNSYNGLIGQSWTLEALWIGYRILGEQKYWDIAVSVWELHQFHDRRRLWWTLKLDGSPGEVDVTLNQQVWFAAMGALLVSESDNLELKTRITDFLDHLPNVLNPYRCGLLRKVALPTGIISLLKIRLTQVHAYGLRLSPVKKIEVAYHVFTLCGLAYLRIAYSDHPFWQLKVLKDALSYLTSSKFQELINANEYAYPYNVTGFEIPFILKTFDDLIERRVDKERVYQQQVAEQFKRHYDKISHLLSKNTTDPDTLAARFYEICRLDECFIAAIVPQRNLELR